MDSTRQHKFAKLIQKEVSDIFQHEGRNYYGNAFLTVTGVRVTPDLGIAYVQVSLFKHKDPDKIIHDLNHHSGEIRGKLGNRIRNQARHIPNLKFFHDNSLDYVEKIDEIFKHIDIPKDNDDDEIKS